MKKLSIVSLILVLFSGLMLTACDPLDQKPQNTTITMGSTLTLDAEDPAQFQSVLALNMLSNNATIKISLDFNLQNSDVFAPQDEIQLFVELQINDDETLDAQTKQEVLDFLTTQMQNTTVSGWNYVNTNNGFYFVNHVNQESTSLTFVQEFTFITTHSFTGCNASVTFSFTAQYNL